MPQQEQCAGSPRVKILYPKHTVLHLRRHFQPSFEAHPARPALSTDHSADSACLSLRLPVQ